MKIPKKVKSKNSVATASFFGLRSLRKLNLSDCHILEGAIPNDFSSLCSLEYLDLSRNNFVTLPARLNQLSQLKGLRLGCCKRLQSLPELPSSIEEIDAHDGTVMENILCPSSVYRSKECGGLRFTFSNCFRLSENESSNFVAATLREMQSLANKLPRFQFPIQVREASYKRLCSTKNILTVNGKFPGPTIYATKGETIIVDVYNKGNENITIHWHGVTMPRYPWTDGPEYITQCPIRPGSKFTQKIILSTEEGTLWWHAHSDWTRATVHGAIIIYPKNGTKYPFHKPDREVPIILGEWWKNDVNAVRDEGLATGGDPDPSDALLINGQPGDLYPCSKSVYNFPFLIADTFKLTVDHGKTYLLRIINAALQEALFFSIDKHKMTVVGTDGSYTKPLTRDFITIFPGQTYDVLLEANQRPDHYYMAAITYSVAPKYQDFYDNTTTTAIVQYNGYYTPSSPPSLPYLPAYNDTNASVQVMAGLRSLANAEHPCNVPLSTSTNLIYTVSVNSYPCVNNSCAGANGTRFSSSINNISFHTPTVDILQAYYYNISGIYGDKFPSDPPLVFDFTADYLPLIYQLPSSGTEVRVLEYNSTVDIVFQGTNVLAATHHPMHLHGYSFYVVGWGFGNFDGNKDPLRYNMVDPPFQNTISVPSNGWVAIRFEASNPGVWFMHCHVERHLTWGMETAFIVKNGKHPEAQMLPPPSDMPPC
uniref:Laccase n=1 Tax=Vitis vinifera TaxID=29760 RepID=F6GYA5_VITVI